VRRAERIVSGKRGRVSVARRIGRIECRVEGRRGVTGQIRGDRHGGRRLGRALAGRQVEIGQAAGVETAAREQGRKSA